MIGCGFKTGYDVWKEKELKILDERIKQLRDELSPYKIHIDLCKARDAIIQHCVKTYGSSRLMTDELLKALNHIEKVIKTIEELDKLETKWINIFLELHGDELLNDDLEKEIEEVLTDE